MSLAGALLALLIPALSLTQAVGKGDVRVIVAVVGVLLASVAVALFRPGSAIHRYSQTLSRAVRSDGPVTRQIALGSSSRKTQWSLANRAGQVLRLDEVG